MTSARMRSGMALVALLSVACGGGDGARDASTDARVLDCDGPLEAALVPSTSGSTAGIPIATIAWTGNTCRLGSEERDPESLLLVMDTAGTALGDAVIALPWNDWQLVRSSASESPTSYFADVPRNTDVFVELETEDARSRVRIDFRVGARTLTLLAMREIF